MPYPIRRRLNVRRSPLKPLGGAVVWTLGQGGNAAPAALPPLKVQGDVAYVTGGVGQTAFDAFRQAQSGFPLALEFVRKAAEHDSYIIDVDIDVVDRSGTSVLKVRSDGPYLLARIRDGEYVVKATYFGHLLERRVRVAGHTSARVTFVWEMKL
jgi:hypothetical protein